MTPAQVIGLGCRLNIAESERIGEPLNGSGDLGVINTSTATCFRSRRATTRPPRGCRSSIPLPSLAERDNRGYAENFARVATPAIAPGTIATIIPTACEDDLLR